MKIDTLELTNFRSAESLDIKFNDRLNVLVGVNGAGKTTILESIAILLSWLVSRIQNANGKGSYIKDADVRYDASNSELKLAVSESDNQFWWSLAKTAKGYEKILKSDLGSSSDLASLYRKKLRDGNNLPVIAYYPVSRTVANISPEPNSDVDNYLFEIYENCLSGGSNYSSFFEWFRIQDDILNEENNSKKKWVHENKYRISKKLTNILLTLKGIHSNDDSSSKVFEKPIDDIFLAYEETDFLIHELNFMQYKLAEDSSYDFINLSLFIKKSQTMPEEYAFGVQQFFFSRPSLGRHDPSKLYSYPIQELIWQIFFLVHDLDFWWIKENNRKKITNVINEFRLKFEKVQKKSLQDGNNFYALQDCLKDEVSNLGKNVVKIVNNEINKIRTTLNNQGQEIQAVGQAIERFIPKYKNLRVKRTPRPHMLIDKEDREFNLEHLSDGEKNLITLVGDIARRLAIANPKMKNPLEGDGVVLIDELDLHLHPKWQRLMIPRLQATFPNCQFIVTTHSPQIISHVQPESLILLKNIENNLQYKFAKSSYGKSINRVLEDVLEVETRPQEVINKFNQFENYIDDDDLENAKIVLDELSNMIIGGDPDLVRARAIINHSEMMDK